MKRPDVPRAILLCRVSTTHDEQATSTDRQLARLEGIARTRGWRVVERHCEQASGARVVSRPAVASALDKILRGEADVLVVDHVFRLGRNVREMLEVVDALAACGGAFYEAERQIDTTGPLGRLVFTVYASIGEFEIADRRNKILEGLQRARDRGVVLGAKRKLSVEGALRAAEIRHENDAAGAAPPSWNEVMLRLNAEGVWGKQTRSTVATAVYNLERRPAEKLSRDLLGISSRNQAES